jgi:methylated-DNA-[protein]-cysteine S-methyltransferase
LHRTLRHADCEICNTLFIFFNQYAPQARHMNSEFLLYDTVFFGAPLRLGAYRGRLVLCDWISCPGHGALLKKLSAAYGAPADGVSSELLLRAEAELAEYALGARRSFDVPLLFTGTAFQRSVCLGLQTVPYGAALSYSAFAAKLGAPRAVRAAAGALSHNPISLFLPCHRIIPAGGGAGNYRGGALLKEKLLALENQHRNSPPPVRTAEVETT